MSCSDTVETMLHSYLRYSGRLIQRRSAGPVAPLNFGTAAIHLPQGRNSVLYGLAVVIQLSMAVFPTKTSKHGCKVQLVMARMTNHMLQPPQSPLPQCAGNNIDPHACPYKRVGDRLMARISTYSSPTCSAECSSGEVITHPF